MKTRKLNDKNKKKLKNYNIHIGRKVGDRKQTYKDPEEDQEKDEFLLTELNWRALHGSPYKSA